MELVIRYLHFLSILTIAGSIFYELVAVKSVLKKKEINQIAIVDGIYGISAIILLITGFLQWFYFGKGSDFYSQNIVFLTKISLAFLMGILSVPPTIFFLKNRKIADNDTVTVPAYVKTLIIVEVIILIIIPLLAVLMARGIGYQP